MDALFLNRERYIPAALEMPRVGARRRSLKMRLSEKCLARGESSKFFMHDSGTGAHVVSAKPGRTHNDAA